MNISDYQSKHGTRLKKTVLAFKAARLLKGLSRKDVGRLCGCSHKSISQIENGQCNFSEDRIRRLVEGMGVSWKEFVTLREDPKKTLAQISDQKPKERSLDRKPRRNHYKIVTKEVRAIRTLRKRAGLSQYRASQLCGYVPGGFGHIEAGRIDLKKERIEHILKCLGFEWDDFEKVVNAPVLRDELIDETVKSLHRLDDSALSSAANIIKALIK